MKTAAELLDEAQHFRKIARLVRDPQALQALKDLIAELERRARELENGGADE